MKKVEITATKRTTEGTKGAANLRRAKRVPCVLEKMLPLAAEISVIVARGRDGQMVHLPPQRNLHRDGILAVTEVHDQILPARLAQQAIDAAKSIAEGLAYVGVLCVEFFVLSDGSLVVNEMAPRPHNSGHYSIDACITSQFEQQARVLADLPLGATTQLAPAVMVNLLGDLWHAGEPDWRRILAHDGVKLHLYGKDAPRPGRKMGHVTALGSTIEAALATACAVKRDLGIPESTA